MIYHPHNYCLAIVWQAEPVIGKKTNITVVIYITMNVIISIVIIINNILPGNSMTSCAGNGDTDRHRHAVRSHHLMS